MGDLLVGLQSEAKAFGNSFRPLQEQVLCGHAIETVIDFDRRELLGVEGKHFAVRKFLGVKTPLPLFIRVSRSPNKKPTCARNGCTSVPWHLITPALLGKGRGALCDQGTFLVLGGIRSLRSSMACSSLCRLVQKSPQRSPFSFKRPKKVFIFKVSGRKLERNSRGNRGAETGACGNARTA